MADLKPFIPLVVAVPSALLGYFGYRQSKRVDSIAEKTQITAEQNQSIEQVITGLNSIIANLQIDNATLRKQIEDLWKRLRAITIDHDALKQQIYDLIHEQKKA